MSTCRDVVIIWNNSINNKMLDQESIRHILSEKYNRYKTFSIFCLKL